MDTFATLLVGLLLGGIAGIIYGAKRERQTFRIELADKGYKEYQRGYGEGRSDGRLFNVGQKVPWWCVRSVN